MTCQHLVQALIRPRKAGFWTIFDIKWKFGFLYDASGKICQCNTQVGSPHVNSTNQTFLWIYLKNNRRTSARGGTAFRLLNYPTFQKIVHNQTDSRTS